MKFLGGIIALIFWASSSIAQIEFVNQPYEYGIIDKSALGYIDIPIKNTSQEKVFVFRADVDRRFQVMYSSKEIKPDSTIYMRVRFSPTKKGTFNIEIPVHFSCFQEPKSISVLGYTEEVPQTGIPCPHFSQQSVNTSLNFELEVKVIDAFTRNPIEDAQVLMVKGGVVRQELYTDKKGEIEKEVELGLYYFVANAEGYDPVEFPNYVNRNNNYVLIEMTHNEPVVTEVIPDPEPEPVPDPIPDPDPEPIPDPVIEDTATVVTVVEVKDDPYPDFSLTKFKPNNIVFLVDVSTSMRFTGKLDLLKASMIEMTGMLRPVDKITLVAYSEDARVLMPTTDADNKDSIIKTIEGLEARGFTAGGKGLKMAYAQACRAFIHDGNNMIVMATDGDFNMGEENVNKLARKYHSKNVNVSVVGIKNRPLAVQNMKQLAIDGGGHYVHITSYEDAQGSLIEEIKRSSQIAP